MKYSRKDRAQASCVTTSSNVYVAARTNITSDNRTANPVTTGKRKLDTPIEDTRHRFGIVPQEVVDHTLLHTTQLAERCGEMPLHRRYKTKFVQLRYRRLKSTLY